MKKEIIECRTIYRHKKHEIILDKCWIIIEGCEYYFAFLVKKAEDMKHLSCRSKEWNEKLYEYRLDKDFGKIIDKRCPERKIALKNTHISDLPSFSGNCRFIILGIDRIDYTMPTNSHVMDGKIIYRLSPVASVIRHSLPKSWGKYGIKYHDLPIIFSDKTYVFHFEAKDNLVCIITDNDGEIPNNKDLEDLRLLLSLFFHVPIEIWSIDSFNDGVLSRSNYHFKAITGENKANCMDYIDFGGHNNLTYFLKSVHFYEDSNKKELIIRSIQQYVNAQYLEANYKYTSLFSILLAIAEKIHNIMEGDEYRTITKLLIPYGIEPRRLDEGISKKGFQSLIDQKPITTFADLRDEIIHELTSGEIIDDLPTMISSLRLEYCVLIVILKELGVQEIKFNENFKELSVFK